MTTVVRLVLIVAALATPLAACSTRAGSVDDLSSECRLDPVEPVAGESVVATLTLRRPDGRPVLDAAIELEGHMAHPGMAPVVIPLSPLGDGRYQATTALTMGGEWRLFVSGRLADGRFIRRPVADVVARMKE